MIDYKTVWEKKPNKPKNIGILRRDFPDVYIHTMLRT